MTAVIDHPMQARLIAQPPAARSLTASLRYEGSDPLAVQMVFPPDAALDGTEVTWTFSRDLLERGLGTAVGEGDVQVWPCGPESTVIELHSSEGVAVLEFRSADLRQFLFRSYETVPAGQEYRHLGLDRGLAALLRGV
ncbi:SsgA family sporulation/cell division regulator [Streptomyces sp. AJS327]|uniref:SsgA family sporulation/cell division regulator n=1 Tax=Streptomyces sp. AJS327 TaxID=2545265 RepID=UPI0015DD5218|nr:SsgA family sporulation/cell division regulator [Streptomyces sp. AJS327]MBA0049360.1 SsgA family sporulation/cell division regulator [Streptomyces sp. AJS327]